MPIRARWCDGGGSWEGSVTDLDLSELLALCEDEVHVLVKRKHLPNQTPTIVPSNQTASHIRQGQRWMADEAGNSREKEAGRGEVGKRWDVGLTR